LKPTGVDEVISAQHRTELQLISGHEILRTLTKDMTRLRRSGLRGEDGICATLPFRLRRLDGGG